MALWVVTEKVSLGVARHLFRTTTKTSGQALFLTLLLHTMCKDAQVSRVQDAQERPLHPWR